MTTGRHLGLLMRAKLGRVKKKIPVSGGGGGPLLLYAVNPTTRTHGYFVLSPVSKDQDGGQLNLPINESHGKIGDCEQSVSFEEQITSKEKYPSMFSRQMKAVVFI